MPWKCEQAFTEAVDMLDPLQELYKQEGITCDFSDFPDNQALLELRLRNASHDLHD